jgi:hypothetical protein
MKVGSLVELIQNFKPTSIVVAIENAITLPVKGEAYTVRAIVTRSGKAAILLEEIINPDIITSDGITEVGFCIKLFRELQPPMDLTELVEESQAIKVAEPITNQYDSINNHS